MGAILGFKKAEKVLGKVSREQDNNYIISHHHTNFKNLSTAYFLSRKAQTRIEGEIKAKSNASMRTTSANTGLPLENVQTIHATCLTNARNLVKSVVSLRHCSFERTKKNKIKTSLIHNH